MITTVRRLTTAVLFVSVLAAAQANEVTLSIDTPMSPPTWALLERELIRTSTRACQEFFAKYFDKRGYLKCIERWGGNDGPDDAIENVAGWPLLHTLGAPDVVLEMYRKAWEGHLRQYTEAKTIQVPFARDGMYYKEFPVMMDWMHNGEGLRVFNLQGLSEPGNHSFTQRVRRYAGFYMNEDPQARNYDPNHRIIRSLFNGSRGPLLRRTTALDWAGDAIEVEGRFSPGHGERNYEEMLAHFKDYNDIVGDHPQNMCATTLAVNAWMLTGETKYRQWLLEYVDAWLERLHANNGIIPSNIGLDGTIGGEVGGRWYGGVYGWSFSVKRPENGSTVHRNRVGLGLTGFGNAWLLTGDRRYIDCWAQMLDRVNSNHREVDGKTMYPRMYGDDGWYAWQPTPWSDGALDCWFWSCETRDLKRVKSDPWVAFLRGTNPGYAEQSLRADFETIRSRVAGMRGDPTTPDTRLADDPAKFNPAAVGTLRQLMMAGLDPGRTCSPLHCRVRYFDPIRRRAGIPRDVAALVDRMSDRTIRLTLVNISQSEARTMIVQTGAYGEHQCVNVSIGDRQVPIDSPWLTIQIAPGAGARILLETRRYVNDPTLSFPWDRG